MSIAPRVAEFLKSHDIDYDVVSHPYSEGSLQTALAAKVPIEKMVKAVILEDHEGKHIMAILPAGSVLRLRRLKRALSREFTFLPENKLMEMFADCERGAIPPLGDAYHIDMIYEDTLNEQDEYYIEAGDHRRLIQLGHDQFSALLQHAKHAHISFNRGFAVAA